MSRPISRKRIAKPMIISEAGKGTQILGMGPQGLMSGAAFIAARVAEGSKI